VALQEDIMTWVKAVRKAFVKYAKMLRARVSEHPWLVMYSNAEYPLEFAIENHSENATIAGLILVLQVKDLFVPLETDEFIASVRQRLSKLKAYSTVKRPCVIVIADMENLPGFNELLQVLPAVLVNNEFGLQGPIPSLAPQWELLYQNIYFYLTRHLVNRSEHAINHKRLQSLWSWHLFGEALKESCELLDKLILSPFTCNLEAVYFTSSINELRPLAIHSLWLQREYTLQGNFHGQAPLIQKAHFRQGMTHAVNEYKTRQSNRFSLRYKLRNPSRRLCRMTIATCLCFVAAVFSLGLVGYQHALETVLPSIRIASDATTPPRERLRLLHKAREGLLSVSKLPRALFWEASRLQEALADTVVLYQESWLAPTIIQRLVGAVRPLPGLQTLPRHYYTLLLAADTLKGEVKLPQHLVQPLLRSMLQRVFTHEERVALSEDILELAARHQHLAIKPVPGYAEAVVEVARIPALEKAQALLEASAGCVLEPMPSFLWQHPRPLISCAYQRDFQQKQLNARALEVSRLIVPQITDMTQWQQFPLNEVSFSELLVKRYYEEYPLVWQHWLAETKISPAHTMPILLAQLQELIAPKSALALLLQQVPDNVMTPQQRETHQPLLLQVDVALNQVRELLQRLHQSEGAGSQAWEIYKSGAVPLTRFKESIREAPSPLQSWLQQIEVNIQTAIAATAFDYQNGLWKQQVVDRLFSHLNELPFNSAGAVPTAPAIVNAIYGPDGAIEQFALSLSARIPGELLSILDKMRGLNQNPHVIVKAIRLSKNIRCLRFTVNGSQTEYCHGPLNELTLPLTTEDITLEIESFSQQITRVNYSGPWALFKWWQQGEWSSTAALNQFEFKHSIGPYQLYFTSVSPINVVPSQIYQALSVPQKLLNLPEGRE
jgi:hypothetical protein